MIKKSYKVSGMDCASCASMLELDLEDKGFLAKCDYVKETLEVEIDDKSEEEKVKEAVKSLGYDLA